MTVTDSGPVWASFYHPTPTPPRTPTPAPDYADAGSWKGVYGADGFYLAAGPQRQQPVAAVVCDRGADRQQQLHLGRLHQRPPALQKTAAGSTDRLAACWYANDSFSIDVHLTDGQAHQAVLYALDWDSLTVGLRRDGAGHRRD